MQGTQCFASPSEVHISISEYRAVELLSFTQHMHRVYTLFGTQLLPRRKLAEKLRAVFVNLCNSCNCVTHRII